MVSRVEKVGAQPLVEAGAGMPKSLTDGLILSSGEDGLFVRPT